MEGSGQPGLLALLSGAAAYVEAEEHEPQPDAKKARRKYRKSASYWMDGGTKRRQKHSSTPTTVEMVDQETPINAVASTEIMTGETDVDSKPSFLPVLDDSTPLVIPEEVTHTIIPTAIEEAVSRAVSIISSEILKGIWWSPRNLSDLDGNIGVYGSHIGSLEAAIEPPITHLIRFTQALETFSKHVIGPTLIAHHVQDNQGRRAFLATCMMLREVLITNAEGVFYPVAVDFASIHPDNKRAAYEEQTFSNSIVVTAMIFSALKKLDDALHASNTGRGSSEDASPSQLKINPSLMCTSGSTSSLCEDFSTLLSDFHTMSHSFDPKNISSLDASDSIAHSLDAQKAPLQNSLGDDNSHLTLPRKRVRSGCLPRYDFRHVGMLPRGQLLPEYENLIWRVSCNIARERHFLSQSSTQRKASHTIRRLIPPAPNVAAVYMVEHVEEAYRQHLDADSLNRNKESVNI